MEAKTERIKVMVSTEEVRELEVSFPYYTKDDGLYCKFLSKDEAIWVSYYSFKKQIEYSNCGVPEDWLSFEPITESEFNEQFNEVMTALIDIKNEKTI